MTWYIKFGYDQNPLSIKPNEDYDLFFDEKNVVDDVLDVISEGGNLVIKGPLGTGKTSILKQIIYRFGGHKKIYYYNAYSASTPLDFDRVIKRAGNVFSRLFGVRTRDVVLFIDEAQHLNEENIEELNEYLPDYFRSVVLASSASEYKVPKVLEDYFEKEINTANFTESDAFNIVNDRFDDEYEEIVSKEEVKECYNRSKTPREFLLELEELCKNKHDN